MLASGGYQKDGPQEQRRRDHHEERRQEPAGSTRVEGEQIDGSALTHLIEQQRRDQKTRDNEEDVDADEATGKSRHADVVGNHNPDRYGAQTIDIPAIANTCHYELAINAREYWVTSTTTGTLLRPEPWPSSQTNEHAKSITF